MEKRGLSLDVRGVSVIGRRSLLYSWLVLLLFLAGCPSLGSAAERGGNEIGLVQEPSVLSERQGRFTLAEMEETADYIEYRAGPSDSEMEDLRGKEEEKEEKSWDMLRNMMIIIDDDRRPRPPRDSTVERSERSEPQIPRSPQIP